MNAIDTNVLLYYIDRDELVKQAQATTLLAALATSAIPTVLLSQVAVEFGAGLTRWMQSNKLTLAQRRNYFQDVSALFPFVLPQSNLVPKAFELAARHTLSYWDSLLLAACVETGIDTLYSEDLSAGVIYDGIKVVNPFV